MNIFLFGINYLKIFIFIFVIDGLLFDDEPVWEPLEWSLAQTWIFFLFVFSWSAEVLFSSKFGLYTNRDKKVWIGLHKTYYFLQFWFLFNMFIVTMFVTLPFYYEISYLTSYMVLWWNWFTAVFFFKLTTIFACILLILSLTKLQLRWLQPQVLTLNFFIIILLISNLLYFNFITTFFAFFSDVNSYSQSGWIDKNVLTQGPVKWGYGGSARDHFSYHRTTGSFWFKNDPLIAASLLFLNLFIFFYLFFLFLQLLILARLVYTNHLVSFNNITFFYSSVKHFYFILLFLFFLLFLCFIYQLIRFPFEFYWFSKVLFLGLSFCEVVMDLINMFVTFLS